MAFKWCCKCVSPETEDVRELNYQQMMLLDVPAEVFAYERTLEELYLDSNKIRDLPRPLFHCHGLKVLSMSENEVRSLPPAIASLINLQYIDLSKNDLRGIPDNIKGCKHLTYINVAANPLEKLPEGFTQLLCLEEVYLNDTLLEFLPANFGRLTKLRILELRANNLNTLPKSIARLCNLERLDIGQNDFAALPEVIGSLTNLRELWIDGNAISSIPSFIGNLKKLNNLDASHNHISFIAEEIEECKELTDLYLSDNELMELPHVIGELKQLATLRCDENQLKELPETIGQLVNLEELILNQNDIEELPPQIGLLRRLHMLNLDDNLLEHLPPEIGSCSGLTILSVRGNRLQEIPAEVGHLPQIRVLNLAENYLRNLPVSILNLTQLTALWLSNNQSTPLTTLQQEIDPRTGQTVCVNFMLPQPLKESVYHDRYVASSPKPDQWAIDKSTTAKLRERQHIRFATDTDSEEPHSLLRAPTPYPKELRNMSKRQQKKLQKKQGDEEAPLLGEMVSPGEKDRLIKEAKVKKPSTVSVSNTAVPKVESEIRDHESVTVDMSSGHSEYVSIPAHPPVYDECVPSQQKSVPLETQESNSEDGSPILPSGSGPVIRKAKYVRRGLCSSAEAAVETDQQEQKQLKETEQHAQPQQPPPYHIAAAHSKQAAHFLSRLEARINNLTLDTSLSSTELQASQKEKDSDDNESGSYVIFSDQDTSVKCTKNVSEHFQIPDAVPDPSTSETTVQDIKVTEMKTDTIEAPGNFIDEPDFIKDATVEDQCMKNVESVNTSTSTKEMPFSDLTEIQHAKEAASVSPKCKIPVRLDSLTAKPTNFQEETLTKPWTFIQDKPSVSDLIVAPTPQRPGSTHSSVTSPVLSSKTIRPSSTSPSRAGSKIPAPLPSYNSAVVRPEAKSLNGTNWSAHSPDGVSSSSLEISSVRSSPSKFSPKAPPVGSDSWSLSSPNTTRIPQPGFYSNAHPSYHHSSKRSSVSSHSSSNSRPGSIAPLQNTWDAETGHNYQNLPHSFMSTDHNLNISAKNSISPTSSLKPSANGVESNTSMTETGSARSPLSSKIPLLMSSGSSPAHMRKISSSSSPGEKDASVKQAKAWMFGPHKNATVFPVVIHKNPGLGFSITGGISSPGLADKKENQGIFISKIHPNGPASSHLLPGDKILEVDGIDFTKVGHDQAVGILKQTGSVVNMMISRNQ